MPSLRSRIPAAALGALSLALAAPAAHADWVASWGAAPAVLSIPSLRTTTVRQFLRLSVGGTQVRVRFSNETGTQALTIGGAHLSRPGSGAGTIDPASDHVLTFGGSATASLPPGAPLLSDPVDLPAAALTTLVVTALIDSTSPRQVGHLIASETAYLLPGDHTADAGFAGATTSDMRYALSGIEVNTPGQSAIAIGTLGDSITDGLSSSADLDRRWTDRLAERLAARTGTPMPGVVNGGLTGNSVVGGALLDVVGQSALARLDRDVLSRPGLRWLVMFEGINDVIFSATTGTVAADLEAAYRQVVARAHDRGVRVLGGTLTAFAGSGAGYYSPAKESARQAVNAWIREAGSFDAVVDFDAALRDPSKPRALLPLYDSGDHLHPNDAGYRAMGDAVPLELFR